MPPDPRTVLPVTITDSLSAPDDVIMVEMEAFPGDGRSGPVFVDVHSSVQTMEFGIALYDDDPMIAHDYWNMPVGAKFYMLYVDDDNHVRGETYIYPGGTTVFIGIYVRKGGVDTKIGDGLGENGGWITFQANAELNHLWLLSNSTDIFSFNFQYDLWVGYPFDPDFFPHGGKMGYDFSGVTNWTSPPSSLRATKMWSYERHYGSVNVTSTFWAAGFPTSIPGWVATALPDHRIATAVRPVSASSLSRWFHRDGGVTAAPEGYTGALLLKETNAEGGGTMRARCVRFPSQPNYSNDWSVFIRARTDLLSIDPVMYPDQELIGFRVGFDSSGSFWAAISPVGTGPVGESFDGAGFGEGDVIEVSCYDVLDSDFVNYLRDFAAYHTDAEAVTELESLFNPESYTTYYPVVGGITQPDGTPLYDYPWQSKIEVRINDNSVYESDPIDNGTTRQLLGSAWGFQQSFWPTGGGNVDVAGYRHIVPADGSADVPQQYEVANDQYSVYGDFEFQPYCYGPIAAMAFIEVPGTVDAASGADTFTIDAHASQIIAPYVRSSSIVRYVFDDGAGRRQDSSLSSVTWEFDPSDVDWDTAKEWNISLTVYNEEGLSDTYTQIMRRWHEFGGFGEMPTAARSFEQAFQPRTPSGPTATQESKFR